MLTKSTTNHRGGAIKERQDKLVVFSIIRDSICADCRTELLKGRFLRVESDRPLCLSCADLDHLVFLPAGDAALTRRAVKYSTLAAGVLRWGRGRQGSQRTV